MGILVLLFLSGCKIHHEADLTPGITLPGHWAETDSSGNADDTQAELDTLSSPWWLVFEDEQLNLLESKALEGNYGLKQAYARIHQFEAMFTQAHAARMPQVSLKGSKNRGRSLSNMGFAVGETANLSLSASYEIDLWGKLKNSQQSRQYAMEASAQDLQTLMLSLSAQVADTYYLLMERNQQMELAGKTLKSRSDTLDLISNRYREGLVSSLDVYQAKQALALSQSKIPQIERDLAQARHAMSVLLGTVPETGSELEVPSIPDLSRTFAKGLPSELLKNRPDIRAEILRLKSADRDVGTAIANRFPSLNLMGDYGTMSMDSGSTISGTVWNLLANVAMPLIDWGGRKAAVEQKKAVFEEKMAHYNETVLNAFREVEDALTALEKMEEIRHFQQEESRVSEAAWRLSRERYLDGLSEYLPVLTAEIMYIDSLSRLIATRRQIISGRISLARALGGHWMELNTQETKQALKETK